MSQNSGRLFAAISVGWAPVHVGAVLGVSLLAVVAPSVLAQNAVRAVVLCPLDGVPGIGATARFSNGLTPRTLIDNAGRIAFASNFLPAGGGLSSGIWSQASDASPGVLTLIAQQGGFAPAIDGSPSTLAYSILEGVNVVLSDNGRVAFTNQLASAGAPWGVFAQQAGGAVRRLALNGDASPTTPASTWTMDNSVAPAISRDGRVAFRAQFSGGLGVFSGLAPGVGQCGRTLVGGETTGFLNFSNPQVTDLGTLTLFCGFRQPSGDRTGLWSGACGSLVLAANPGVAVPVSSGLPSGTAYSTFISASTSNTGGTVFNTALSGPDVTGANGTALWRITPSNAFQLVARQGAQVPGLPAGVNFGSSGDGTIRGPLASDSGAVVWAINLQGAVNTSNNRAVMLRRGDGVTRVVARTGDQMPGYPVGTVIGTLPGSPAINAVGQVVYTATVSNPPSGRGGSALLSTDAAGESRILLESNQATPIRPGLLARLSNLGEPLPSGGSDGLARNWNDRGELAIRATYQDVASFPNSGAAVIVVRRSCSLSDVAGPNQANGADGVLTADDIIVFLGWFFASDLRADVAGANQLTTPDGVFTADDIIVFLGRFFAGC